MAGELIFQWDEAKAASNLEKHGVSFELAVEAFFAEDSEYIEDLRQPYGEERFNLRASVDGFPLIVTYTFRPGAGPHHLRP